jgi:hypothetical protein
VHELGPGSVLHSGGRYVVGLAAHTEIFAYLFQMDSDGGLYRLFPLPGELSLLEEAEEVWLPGGGLWLELDQRTGWERLLLVISEDPLLDLEEASVGVVPPAVFITNRPKAGEDRDGVLTADYGGRSFAVGRRLIYTNQSSAVYILEFRHL